MRSASARKVWKDSFLNRRCLVPGTSFREAKGRNPAEDFWFALIGDEARPLFAFAGLWRRGQPGIEGEEGGWITHTMVTTTPNKLVEPVHPTRMPVILDPQDYEDVNGGAKVGHGGGAKPGQLVRMCAMASALPT